MNIDATDDYTIKTMGWLNRRYRMTNQLGIYLAHQPIYGPQDLNSEPNIVERYIRTCFILNQLARLGGSTHLDVGASEGYQANLAKQFLGLRSDCVDLAFEAGRRARELFNLDGCQSDARRLPFRNGSFDLVTCSETLEHIPDFYIAVDEMIRIANKAVVITVPHEPPDSIDTTEIHAHINNFEMTTFDFLKKRGLEVLVYPLVSQYIFRISRFVERVRSNPRIPTEVVVRIISAVVEIDHMLLRIANQYYCLVFTILKNPGDREQNIRNRVPISKIISWRREHYCLK